MGPVRLGFDLWAPSESRMTVVCFVDTGPYSKTPDASSSTFWVLGVTGMHIF